MRFNISLAIEFDYSERCSQRVIMSIWGRSLSVSISSSEMLAVPPINIFIYPFRPHGHLTGYIIISNAPCHSGGYIMVWGLIKPIAMATQWSVAWVGRRRLTK